MAGDEFSYARRRRVHYRADPDSPTACGTLGRASKLLCSGDEFHVSCRACLKVIRRKKRDGEVDLFGNAA